MLILFLNSFEHIVVMCLAYIDMGITFCWDLSLCISVMNDCINYNDSIFIDIQPTNKKHLKQ